MFTIEFLLVVLIFNGIISHFVGKLAEERRLGYTSGFLLSFLLSPVLGLLFTIASQVLTPEEISQKNSVSSTVVNDNNDAEPQTISGVLIAAAIVFMGILVGFYL